MSNFSCMEYTSDRVVHNLTSCSAQAPLPPFSLLLFRAPPSTSSYRHPQPLALSSQPLAVFSTPPTLIQPLSSPLHPLPTSPPPPQHSYVHPPLPSGSFTQGQGGPGVRGPRRFSRGRRERGAPERRGRPRPTPCTIRGRGFDRLGG